MAGKAATTPVFALGVYIAMGDKRSIAGLQKKLAKMGHSTSRATLMAWQKKHEWNKAVGATATAIEHQAKLVREVAAEELKQDPSGQAFTANETFDGAFSKVNAMLAGLSTVVAKGLADAIDRAYEPDQLLAFARAAVDLGRTAADMHRALNPPPPKGAGAKRDPETGVLEGHLAPGLAALMPQSPADIMKIINGGA